ncbi:hypothetical protein [Streptomyces sp. SPB162]|uniref:hypothetical protein n=1 Tax=Streptomyces sp. SPB162 TaxID=2940560 RepID=UPI0024065234|nr:hypothetical protein [Streptomyces sp. SPB162]MDF9815691.1 ATP synthase protein I [Streptomyces sp. SPB162]
MQSNDVRMFLNCAVPSAAAGVIAVVVSGVLAGGKGAIGAAFGTFVVIAFMSIGLLVLQRVAKSYPALFQMMGLALYTTQILLLAVILAVFKNTSLFNQRAFAFALLGTTLVWIAAQARAHMKAKILYVEPDSAGSTS